MNIYIAPEKMSDFDKKFALASQMNLTSNEWKKFFSVYIPEEGEAAKIKYYKTSAECVADAPKIPGMMVDPTLDKTKGWYPNYVKKTDTNKVRDYLYTKADPYGNVSNVGIIPYNIQNKIGYGQPLTDEDKIQIKNNHNLQKSLLDKETLTQVEMILKQLGIPLEETPAPTIIPETSKKDEFGFVIGETRILNGTTYKYIGDNKWEF